MCGESLIYWAEVMSGFLAPVVAIFGIYFGCMQLRIAQNKLKLDLFEKRSAIYEAARTFILEVGVHGNVSDTVLREFRIGTADARWLFNDEIGDYFWTTMWEKATKLQLLVNEADPETSLQRYEIKKWLRDQIPHINKEFKPFLRLYSFPCCCLSIPMNLIGCLRRKVCG